MPWMEEIATQYVTSHERPNLLPPRTIMRYSIPRLGRDIGMRLPPGKLRASLVGSDREECTSAHHAPRTAALPTPPGALPEGSPSLPLFLPSPFRGEGDKRIPRTDGVRTPVHEMRTNTHPTITYFAPRAAAVLSTSAGATRRNAPKLPAAAMACTATMLIPAFAMSSRVFTNAPVLSAPFR